MRETRVMLGMPITVEIVEDHATPQDIEVAFEYFDSVDRKFSLYKEDSEISRMNRGEIDRASASHDMQTVLYLAEKTRWETGGFFEFSRDGKLDPTGVVKGWAIYNAAALLQRRGFEHFYVDAGGDIQAQGHNADGEDWRVGIRSPFDLRQIVKAVAIRDGGIATSGSYVRGSHIYNPHDTADPLKEMVSLTVIGPNVFEADRFATAAFAMGRDGIKFIEWLQGFEGYAIDRNGMATYTSGFERYVIS